MSFDNIIGNDNIKVELKKAITNNQVGHSYIFYGTEGIGKILFAKEFAKEILCKKNNGCGECKSCIMFNSNNHPDFTIINEEEDTIKIEDIRTLIKKAIEKPIISKNKVYIINGADKMTKDAQNCLLKTLEEPPEYVIIILISSNDNLLLTTIKSRCTKIIFNKLTDKEILKYISDKKDIDLKQVTDRDINLCGGSIKRFNKILDNKEIYKPIEEAITNINKLPKVEFYVKIKKCYTKEEIHDILEYTISILFELGKFNTCYMNGISIVQDTINKLKENANFDMCIDSMVFRIWEDINENNSWS